LNLYAKIPPATISDDRRYPDYNSRTSYFGFDSFGGDCCATCLCLSNSRCFIDAFLSDVPCSAIIFRFYGDETIAYYTAHEKKDMAGIDKDNVLGVLTKDTTVMHDHYPDVLIIPKTIS